MKFNRIKTLLPAAALALTMSTTSCIGDLDVDPTIDQSTSMVFERDQVFAKIYANMALSGQQGPAGNGDIDGIDEGTSDFFRQIWNMNELATDEAICSWGDAGIPEYNFASWDASHGMVTAMYYRLYFGITMANYFLEQTEGDASATDQRAEARFLRALYYYYAMDFSTFCLRSISCGNSGQERNVSVEVHGVIVIQSTKKTCFCTLIGS